MKRGRRSCSPAALAWITSLFTTVKWFFAGAGMLLVLIGLVRAALNGFRTQEPGKALR